jgi:hypothetical protein
VKGRTAALVWIALLAAVAAPRAARACSTCSCGDPTLTGMGAEKPYRGRLRAAVAASYRTDEIGDAGLDQVRLREERLDLGLAWAPHQRLFFAATLPLLWRQVMEVNAAETSVAALGDIELRLKGFVFQDRALGAHHLIAAILGARFPTAIGPEAAPGPPLPDEALAGSGALWGIAGASYAWFERAFSLYSSASVSLPLSRARTMRVAPAGSLLTTVAVQFQLNARFALRAGVDTRLDGKAELAGMRVPHTGGFIAFSSAELLFSPMTDVLLGASARVPVWNALDGAHREGAIFGLFVAYDVR